MRIGILLAMAAAVACAGHRAAQQAPPPAAAPVAAAAPVPAAVPVAAAPDVFRADVAPLLARRCTPCHVPGGKMYEALPFNDPDTVASHPEGVLKRLKDPDEHALVERWIATRPKS